MPPPPLKKKAAVRDPDVVRDRARGALLGLAVGDALGTTLEFKPLSAPPFPERATGPHRDITGGGPFAVRPGQVTDDTQMACALALSLRVCKVFSPEDAINRYRAWLPAAFDVGNQTRSVLEAYAPNLGPFAAARTHWLSNGKKPAGNGSLMRTAPLGVFFAEDRQARIRASLEESALTHYDPRCQLACAVFNGAIASAIQTLGDVDPKKLVASLGSELSVAAAALGRMMPNEVRDVHDAVAAIKEDLAMAEKPDPLLYGPELHLQRQQGFVRVAFRFAFWELLHAESFEAALVDVVNRGGDSDTNAAICGALLGAVYGESAIPSAWRRAVLDANPTHPALRTTYHPRELLPLVG